MLLDHMRIILIPPFDEVDRICYSKRLVILETQKPGDRQSHPGGE